MSIKSGYDSLPRGLVDPREMKVGMRLGGEFPNGKRIDLRYFIVDIEYNNKGCRYSGEVKKVKCWDIIEDAFVYFEGDAINNLTKTRSTSFFNYNLTDYTEYINWERGDYVVFRNPKKLENVKNPAEKHVFSIFRNKQKRVDLIDNDYEIIHSVPKSLLMLYERY